MKRFLIILILPLFVASCKCFAQAVYAVFATEPSGILVSPGANNKPNTATVKSGQTIKLDGFYDQGLALWYGDGLPEDGAVFGTAVKLNNTGTESISKTFRVNNSNTNAITVTILPQQGTHEPSISTSSFCTSNPTLTANGCSGSVQWYTRGGFNPIYSKTAISGATNITYSASSSGSYFASCTVAGVESYGSTAIEVGSTGVQPFIFLSTPHPNKSYPTAKNTVCMWSDYTLEASGLGINAGTVTWYEKIGTATASDIGTGQSKAVKISNLNTNYYAQLSVSGCAVRTSGTHNFNVEKPSAVAATGERHFKVHGQSMNILADDNCQIIAGFSPNLNNNGVNVMLDKMMTARVSRDNSIKLYNGQPYLQRHFDFEPDNIAEAQNAWYSVQMHFTQAEFDAFNAVSSVKLPSNNSETEQQKLSNLRIWQTHGVPTSQPATPGNYSDGPVTDYGCVACRSVSWNTEKNWWEVHLNTAGFSGFFITTEGTVALPVTLLNFSAKKQENSVALDWQTTEETNSDHFEIQHSINGKQWSGVGTVGSIGESKTLQHYTYIHSTPVFGENLYRLKMIDRAANRNDASFAYSRIVAIHLDENPTFIVYPNPATTELKLQASEAITEVKLYNSNGTKMFEKVDPKGNLKMLSLPKLTSGLYQLQISSKSGIVETKKIVIR